MMGSGRWGFVQALSLKTKGRARRPAPEGFALLTDAELVDDRAVTLHVGLPEVVEKTATAADELQEAAAGMMILRVRLEVLSEVGNAVREECDLHFWRPGIGVMDAILVDEVRLLLLGRRQNPVSLIS